MVPGSVLSWLMIRPRLPATDSRVSSSMPPAQCSAVSSPRLWPAAATASMPRSDSTRRPAIEEVTMRGWATAVSTRSVPSGSCRVA